MNRLMQGPPGRTGTVTAAPYDDLMSVSPPALGAHPPRGGRAEEWAATMAGHQDSSTPAVLAHPDAPGLTGSATAGAGRRARGRLEREALEQQHLSGGATLSNGAGNRDRPEEPDPLRTCFERDRDRILHGTSAFRRLAGKTQVFIFPDDHQRTRLTHALEVAQVATAIARAIGVNVALSEAIALGHDCGHGPGGHASEDAFSVFLPEGYDHAVWGADVVLSPLNLCHETLDGVRNHSWSRPSPSTPEGEVVAWADRIAYVCHDFEDAVHAGIVTPQLLPDEVRQRCGASRAQQLNAFITDVITTTLDTGRIAMSPDGAEALAAFRAFNYARIYMRPASLHQSDLVIRMLRALVEHFADRPNRLEFDNVPGHRYDLIAGSPDAVREAVTYVAGMTDRYACQLAVSRLGWDPARLPAGVDRSV